MTDAPSGRRWGPSRLAERLRAAWTGTDEARTWEAAEDALIASDVGPRAAADLIAGARARNSLSPSAALMDELRAVFAGLPTADPLAIERGVILLVGINGSGKTTTAAKLAGRLRDRGRSVLLVAADTFRPAAIEQLRLWADRLGVPIITQDVGADPGAVVFDALAAALARNLEVVIVDTAGRLQNRSDLMAELGKVRRVIERQMPGEPQQVLLVVDATTGQNGLAQAAGFAREAGVTGIALTKLDGAARGGIAVAIAAEYRLPICLIGTGEGEADLAPFDPESYLAWLVGS